MYRISYRCEHKTKSRYSSKNVKSKHYKDSDDTLVTRYCYTIEEASAIIKHIRFLNIEDFTLMYSLKFLKNLCNS